MNKKEALKVFGLSESLPEEDLKKLYRKLARERHPDKGGSTESMAELSEAYKVLMTKSCGMKVEVFDCFTPSTYKKTKVVGHSVNNSGDLFRKYFKNGKEKKSS